MERPHLQKIIMNGSAYHEKLFEKTNNAAKKSQRYNSRELNHSVYRWSEKILSSISNRKEKVFSGNIC